MNDGQPYSLGFFVLFSRSRAMREKTFQSFAKILGLFLAGFWHCTAGSIIFPRRLQVLFSIFNIFSNCYNRFTEGRFHLFYKIIEYQLQHAYAKMFILI